LRNCKHNQRNNHANEGIEEEEDGKEEEELGEEGGGEEEEEGERGHPHQRQHVHEVN
jgi:hypothetical protein